MLPLRDFAWQEIASWKGSGTKQTEPFRIDRSTWVIEWTLGQGSCNAQLLQVFVYGEEEFPDVAVNTLKAGSDRIYMYGKGTHHLQMNAMGSWTVRVLSQGQK